MKWGEKLVGSKEECLQYLYQMVNQLAGGTLVLEGKDVVVPADAQMEYKVKYSEDPGESKFSLKVVWTNDIVAEEAEEDEADDEAPAEAPVEVPGE